MRSPRPAAAEPRLPSRAGLAAFGLAFAAMTIVALALVARFELDREATLHREVISGLQLKGSLEALRTQLNDLRHHARFASLGASPDSLQQVERRAVEVDAELAYLSQHATSAEAGGRYAALADAARLLVVNARSAAARQRLSQPGAWLELDAAAAEAMLALERLLDWQSRRINERTLAQMRIAEDLRVYVSWLLAGSIAVLLGLFGFYGWAKVREERASRRIAYLAHHDTVTGLPNRALLNDRLEQALARGHRAGEPFALLLFDLDGFKLLNDARGHAIGDAALRMVAERARQCVRASDTLGRMGGDEFLAVLPNATVEGALTVAEKLRAAIAVPYDFGGYTATLSSSVGVSAFPMHGSDADALQSAADAALYEAKRLGKNRVCVSNATPALAPAAAVS
jgi:diguanylate cyclase